MCKNATKETKKKWQTAGLIASVVLFVLSIAATGIVIFQKTYYKTFWVKGQSMYPTLNKDAKYKDGTLIGQRRPPGDMNGDYDVDYGFMVANDNAINNIRRFNIVVFRPREDIVSYNIKRVIALPGETFYITSSGDNNENGKLYIKNPNSGLFEYVEQPVDHEYVSKGWYPLLYSEPTTLGPNQYFVMGDNRIGDNSEDSRLDGPISKDLILGKAVGLHAVCTLATSKDNIFPINIKHHWPRWL